MKFLRNFLSTLSALVVFFLILIISLLIIVIPDTDLAEVKERAVLQINLKKTIVDRPHSSEFNFFNSAHISDGLFSIQKAISQAIKDTSIKAVYLKVGDLKGSLANVSSLKRNIQEFKNTGRKDIVHTDGHSQKG